MTTQRNKLINPYGTFTVPRSLDGFAHTSSEFVPGASSTHLPQGPHYFAILTYRDLMWLADDGKPPVHPAHLTPQLASQVTQIWAVHVDTFRTTQQVLQTLPPPEEPDYGPPLHPSPKKRPRLEQTHNQLHCANVTTLGKQVIDWYWTRHQQTCQYFTVRGRTAFGTAAWPNEDNRGTHGGVLVLADPSLWSNGRRNLHRPGLRVPSLLVAGHGVYHLGGWLVAQDE